MRFPFPALLVSAVLLASCGGGESEASSTTLPASTPSPTPTPTPTPTASPTSPVPANYNPARLPDGRQRAFPTAEGFGAAATGGRGGRAIAVTTLADSGTGSLRACMMATGARTCVFRVAGTIELLSQIKPTAGNLTVAGQTAPGGGIAIRNAPSNLTGSPLFLKVPDVIIRHVRIRPGPTSGTKQDTTDAITIDSGAQNTILDHVSLSWATDEPFNSTKASSKITVQWSMVYEGLSKSTHPSGEHSKGMFVEGSDITVHHTLIAHGTDRMPNLGVGARADLVNVVTYNMGQKAHQYFSMLQKQGATTSGLTREVNAVGNWVSMGPSSARGTPIYGADYDETNSTYPGHAALYLSGNIDGRRRTLLVDERLFLEPQDWKYVTAGPIQTLSVELFSSAQQAVRDVLSFAGAFPRDSSDQRVVTDFGACRGAIIDDPSQIGGWPSLAFGTPYTDADSDGMEDAWESTNQANDPNADRDGDGFTNLEEFLNELAGDQDAAGNLIERVGAGAVSAPPVNCGFVVA
ncbi:pectate lyase [Novosphingobium hassiacum]|uniref:Pectate lyase n=1 Tax=Novosphingobium hassiacum TaxID=173676 RepID=A0A7W6A1X4_9SPHN|nr:pectate lyase [Novosphingobium hassiacum]MBB3862552.1 pectate lyase [Novosphingobium hassiacum]